MGAFNALVRNAGDLAVAAEREIALAGFEDRPGEVSASVYRFGRPDLGPAALEAGEVRRLGERPPRPRRRDFESVLLEQFGRARR